MYKQALYYWEEEAMSTRELYVHTDQPGDTSLQLCKYQVSKMAVHDIKFDAIAVT